LRRKRQRRGEQRDRDCCILLGLGEHARVQFKERANSRRRLSAARKGRTAGGRPVLWLSSAVPQPDMLDCITPVSLLCDLRFHPLSMEASGGFGTGSDSSFQDQPPRQVPKATAGACTRRPQRFGKTAEVTIPA
jgi:hypothetical protein